MPEITELLQKWNDGDNEAMNHLMRLVEHDVKRIAHGYMRNERSGHILQTTALINEAFIKLIRENIIWENRKQFYGFIAIRMNEVLCDEARKQLAAQKRNWGKRVVMTEAENESLQKSRELQNLEEALAALAKFDERKASIVKYRFFTGLTIPEIAELLGVGSATVERDWKFTRDWLKHEMTSAEASKKQTH